MIFQRNAHQDSVRLTGPTWTYVHTTKPKFGDVVVEMLRKRFIRVFNRHQITEELANILLTMNDSDRNEIVIEREIQVAIEERRKSFDERWQHDVC